MTMKRYESPRCTVVPLTGELPLATSRVVNFRTDVATTDYEEDYRHDADGEGTSPSGYTPIEWSVVH